MMHWHCHIRLLSGQAQMHDAQPRPIAQEGVPSAQALPRNSLSDSAGQGPDESVHTLSMGRKTKLPPHVLTPFSQLGVERSPDHASQQISALVEHASGASS